jgi:flagellar basal-body rod modification protein FlgD
MITGSISSVAEAVGTAQERVAKANSANSDKDVNNAGDSAAEKARTQLSGDFDTFLLMLTTQLQNQDPTEPMDSNEFTAQLVQFATVEQSIATNENLETMISMEDNAQISTAANYVGKFVVAPGDSARLMGGVASFSYELPQDVYSAEVVITDELGQIVYKGEAPTEAGKNDVLWDGTSNIDGTTKPDGTYHISVIAKDTQLEAVEATTFTTGFVSEVNIEGGEMLLMIGDIELPIDKIISVRDPNDFAA